MPRSPTLATLAGKPVHALAFGFGAGLVPKGPGTAGSLLAIPVFMAIAPLAPEVYLAIVAGLLLIGVWITGRCERELGIHDHPGIVFDEVVGQLVALFLAPVEWPWMLAGFLLFRVFDIWKPGPIGWLNRHVTGGWGIMLDDVAAGLAAAACLQLGVVVYGY